MSGAEVLDVARDSIWTLLICAAPMMVVALVVGVAISLLQALTQIQEMTLAFIPKILALFVTILLALPFVGDVLQSYMARIAERIVSSG
jgi:flagellar biosynthetic protein FliQ